MLGDGDGDGDLPAFAMLLIGWGKLKFQTFDGNYVFLVWIFNKIWDECKNEWFFNYT